MCTAVTFKSKNFYFGRTLDYEFLYPTEVIFTPKRFPLSFRFLPGEKNHHAILGMGYVKDGYPLYYDAVNDKGLCVAGLNFVGNAVYGEEEFQKENAASFEFIPYILGRCESVTQARECLRHLNITDTPFSMDLPASSLHWMIADSKEAITVEAVEEGLRVYTNTAGVLTNNPPFPVQMWNLGNFMNLTPKGAENRFSSKVTLKACSRGMGAMGLPGDFSSQSRFVRAAFVKLNAKGGESEEECVNQMFHILNSVSVPEGCCITENGEYNKTLYSSCMCADRGIYYYRPYESQNVFAVDMNKEELNADSLVRYPFLREPKFTMLN